MGNFLTKLVTLPFTLVGLIISRVLRSRGVPYLRLGWPGSATGSSGDADSGALILDPVQSSRYFLKLLRAHDHDEALEDGLWLETGYDAAVRKAQEASKILLVVLISKEHDDNAAFLRQTLCTRAFRELVREHQDNLLLWGGEVCSSRDAHIASTILQGATYPFMAFLSMQPLAPSRITGSSAPTASAKMAVFSRLEGLSSTSVPHLASHLNDTVLPRLSPFLSRLRSEQQNRDTQRRLREEQDRAYAEAGRRDMERVRAKEAELRAAKESEERRLREQREKERESQNRDAWRRYTASTFGPEATTGGSRIVIRLPDGKRLVRRFAEEEPARKLWFLVDCEANGVSVSKPGFAASAGMDAGYQPKLDFILATTFPRKVLTYDAVGNKSIGQLVAEGLLDKQAASLIVEGFSQSSAQGNESEEEED